MAPTKVDSTRHLPLFIKLLPIIAVIYLAACFAAQAFLPQEKRDLVKWNDPKQAIELSKKSGKAILYDFTAEWCGPCHALSDEVFGDKELSKTINQAFIPVRVMDRQREDGSNLIEIERLQKKYRLEGFPTLVITKPDFIDVKKQVGYPGKDKTKEFIHESLAWSMSQSSPFAVGWRQVDDGIVASRESKKPLLILYWNEKGDYGRFEYLADKELVQLMKSKFVTAETSVPNDQAKLKTSEAKDLLAKLGVRRTPTLVIVPADGAMPHFQIGECSAADNKEFLEKYLRFSGGKDADK